MDEMCRWRGKKKVGGVVDSKKGTRDEQVGEVGRPGKLAMRQQAGRAGSVTCSPIFLGSC